MAIKKKWPNNVSSLSTNKATLVLRLEKIDDTRNHLLEEIKHKIQKVFGANSYVCKSYHGKTGRGPFCPPPPPILNRVNNQNLVNVTKVFLLMVPYAEANVLQALMAPEYWEALE